MKRAKSFTTYPSHIAFDTVMLMNERVMLAFYVFNMIYRQMDKMYICLSISKYKRNHWVRMNAGVWLISRSNAMQTDGTIAIAIACNAFAKLNNNTQTLHALG